MTTRTQQTPSRRWVLVFLAALVAVLATILSSATASAATSTGAETRVRASTVAVDVLVEPPQREPAGQRLGEAGPRVVGVVATGVAANAGEDSVQLFRNVDAAEFDSIADTGRFTAGDGMMEGKWFATTGEHAEQWGAKLNGGQGLTVETRIPRSVADKLHYEGGKLDGIGPGWYADADNLDLINRSMDGIRLWR